MDMLTRFPAGTHHKAHRLHDAPPHWPVSGLAKTTRVPFPDNRFREVIQWALDTSCEREAHVRLPLRGQLRLGRLSVSVTTRMTVPPDSR